MTTLHEAARALLEALDNVGIVAEHDTAAALCGAVVSLRAALAAETDETVRVPRKMNIAQRRAIIQACNAHVYLFPHDGILRSDRIYNAMLAAAQEGKS